MNELRLTFYCVGVQNSLWQCYCESLILLYNHYLNRALPGVANYNEPDPANKSVDEGISHLENNHIYQIK